MTDQTKPDFDGCRRTCRKAGAHTLVWGDCEHAPEPEPTVSLSRVFTAADGQPAIGFDTYTVPQLARLIESAAGDPLRAAAVARAIVHRNDVPAAAVAPAADQTERRDQYAAALYERERPPRDPHWPNAYAADRDVFEAMADAVMAVADAEQAELRAQVERLWGELHRRDNETDQPQQPTAAPAVDRAEMDALVREADRLRKAWGEMLARAERVEAEVERLRADRADALTDAERQFLTFALDLAADQMYSRGDEFGDEDTAALEKLRRLADEAQPDTGAPSAPAVKPCPPGCIACATDESHDPQPTAGARQDGARS